MPCEICNNESGEEKYCKECAEFMKKSLKKVQKKELGRNSVHADIVKMLTDMNAKFIRFSWYKKDAGFYSKNGVSDFSITFPVSVLDCWHGVHIACEVKVGKNKLSALQAEYLKSHIVYGKGIGVVVRSADELKHILVDIDYISDKLARGMEYQECGEILRRSWKEINDALEKVEVVKGMKK